MMTEPPTVHVFCREMTELISCVVPPSKEALMLAIGYPVLQVRPAPMARRTLYPYTWEGGLSTFTVYMRAVPVVRRIPVAR